MSADLEQEIFSKFHLNKEKSVLIQRFTCCFKSQITAQPGILFVLNDYVCFTTFPNKNALTKQKKLKIKIAVNAILICDLFLTFGQGIQIITKKGDVYPFTDIGKNASLAQELLQGLIDGIASRALQQEEQDHKFITQIEDDLQRKAIEASLSYNINESSQSKKSTAVTQSTSGSITDEQTPENEVSQLILMRIKQKEKLQLEQQVKAELADAARQGEAKAGKDQLTTAIDQAGGTNNIIREFEAQILDDRNYILTSSVLRPMTTKKWADIIYQAKFQGMSASYLVNLIFEHRDQDNKNFQEVLACTMESKDSKVKSIKVKIDPFEPNGNTLDDILIHRKDDVREFYQSKEAMPFRGTKSRKIHVKTLLHKPIAMSILFPYTETQTFYVISPRKIVVNAKVQMIGIFYSDSYYVDVLYDFSEYMKPDGTSETQLEVKCELVFKKKVPLVQSKIKDYYQEKLLSSFNNFLKPQLELWIDQESKLIEFLSDCTVPESLTEQIQNNQIPLIVEESKCEVVQAVLIEQEVKSAPIKHNLEDYVSSFIKELRSQLEGKISKEKLDSICIQELSKAKCDILSRLVVEEGQDLNLANQCLNPEENGECIIF